MVALSLVSSHILRWYTVRQLGLFQGCRVVWVGLAEEVMHSSIVFAPDNPDGLLVPPERGPEAIFAI